MKNDSICKRNKYCSFEIVQTDTEDSELKYGACIHKAPACQVEVCTFCGKKVVYKLSPKGDAYDMAKYRVDHIRDTAQPFGYTARVFGECYGYKPVEDLKAYYTKKEAKDQRKKDFDSGWEEMMKWTTSTTTTMK